MFGVALSDAKRVMALILSSTLFFALVPIFPVSSAEPVCTEELLLADVCVGAASGKPTHQRSVGPQGATASIEWSGHGWFRNGPEEEKPHVWASASACVIVDLSDILSTQDDVCTWVTVTDYDDGTGTLTASAEVVGAVHPVHGASACVGWGRGGIDENELCTHYAPIG